MGKSIRASVLILLLACTARADWMPNGSPVPPPPQPATAAQQSTDETTLNGEMPTPGLTQVVLDLLAVLPSLL
jgi:hypothetical protein